MGGSFPPEEELQMVKVNLAVRGMPARLIADSTKGGLFHLDYEVKWEFEFNFLFSILYKSKKGLLEFRVLN